MTEDSIPRILSFVNFFVYFKFTIRARLRLFPRGGKMCVKKKLREGKTVQESVRRFVIDGKEETYLLRRKKVKRLTLRVRPDGSLLVTSPLRLSLYEIERFLSSSGAFIEKARKRAAIRAANAPSPHLFDDGEKIAILGKEKTVRLSSGSRPRAEETGEEILLTLPDPEDIEARKRLFALWEKKACLALVTRLSREIYPLFAPFGVAFPEIRTRRMTSRWGSCHPGKKVVTFNDRLMEAPLPAVEYVVIHEFTHFLVPNHSPAFHRHMDRFCPDWRERKKLLNQSVVIEE